ncbi:MAG TPA: hypothetical protein VG079_01160 [Gaiellaceae bacterium]|nr:hypothetical protein [Gaiellaceae bacterium]
MRSLERRLVVAACPFCRERVHDRGRAPEVVVARGPAGDDAKSSGVAARYQGGAQPLDGLLGAGEDERAPALEGAADLPRDPVDDAGTDGKPAQGP